MRIDFILWDPFSKNLFILKFQFLTFKMHLKSLFGIKYVTTKKDLVGFDNT